MKLTPPKNKYKYAWPLQAALSRAVIINLPVHQNQHIKKAGSPPPPPPPLILSFLAPASLTSTQGGGVIAFLEKMPELGLEGCVGVFQMGRQGGEDHSK